MHDWTLVSVSMDWQKGSASIVFLNQMSAESVLIAKGIVEVIVPRKHPWGASCSVNAVFGPTPVGDGVYRMAIEMQSGDTIEIFATSFEQPTV